MCYCGVLPDGVPNPKLGSQIFGITHLESTTYLGLASALHIRPTGAGKPARVPNAGVRSAPAGLKAWEPQIGVSEKFARRPGGRESTNFGSNFFGINESVPL